MTSYDDYETMAGTWTASAVAIDSSSIPLKPGVVTVPGKPNDDLATGTLASIWSQAGLRP